MSQNTQKGPAFTPKRIRRGIKLDRVQASDFLKYDMVFSCEQCSFYDPETPQCMMSFPHEPHLHEQQMKTFELNGHMAFCRFLEID